MRHGEGSRSRLPVPVSIGLTFLSVAFAVPFWLLVLHDMIPEPVSAFIDGFTESVGFSPWWMGLGGWAVAVMCAIVSGSLLMLAWGNADTFNINKQMKRQWRS